MTDRDSTFLWETAALRESPRRGDLADRPSATPPAGQGWATLREAHYETGIPIETLRKWARRGTVASFLDESEIGVRRMVRMDAVRNRAAELGRPIAPIPRPPANQPISEGPLSPPPSEPEPSPTPHEPQHPEPPATEMHSPEPPDPAEPPVRESANTPEGTMIVPIAAWDKMLMQLGNLHEAGQQLAESRERAAKAETETTFLRERLGELRRELQTSRSTPPASPAPVEPEPEPRPSRPEATPAASAPRPQLREQPQPEKLWRYIYRGWRGRRRW
jgi:hypothetical protein